jgi:hypothetical protein
MQFLLKEDNKMAILSDYKRRKRTVADENGNHIPVSEWTHADSVELSNGLTLEESEVYLTQEEYDELPDEQKNKGIKFWITDRDMSANTIDYDNKNSNLSSTDMQGAIDELAKPTYTTSTTLTKLSSGESIKTALGKLSKSVTDLISHLADNVKHITSDERTKWDGYESSIATNENAISQINSDFTVVENRLKQYMIGHNSSITITFSDSLEGLLSTGITANSGGYTNLSFFSLQRLTQTTDIYTVAGDNSLLVIEGIQNGIRITNNNATIIRIGVLLMRDVAVTVA